MKPLAKPFGPLKMKIGPKTTKLQLFVSENSIDPNLPCSLTKKYLCRSSRSLSIQCQKHYQAQFGLKQTLGKPFGLKIGPEETILNPFLCLNLLYPSLPQSLHKRFLAEDPKLGWMSLTSSGNNQHFDRLTLGQI